MSHKDAVVASLQQCNITFFERDGLLVVPIPVGDSGYFLIDIQVNEEAGDALIRTGVYRVAERSGEDVALCLAELNAKRRYIVWSLHKDMVVMDVCVDLDLAPDPELAFALAFKRLDRAIAEERDRVIAAGRQARSRRRSRVDREIDEILTQAENQLKEGE